eukprot:s1485_g19.t1
MQQKRKSRLGHSLSLLCAAAPDDDGEGHGIMPTFMLPRACMGIVCLFFLKFQGSFKSFTRELYAKFPCCIQPLEDLSTAFRFWEERGGSVLAIAEPLGAQELADDMEEASKLLAHQRSGPPCTWLSSHVSLFKSMNHHSPDTLFLSPFVGNCQIIDRLMRTGTIKPKILYLPINPLVPPGHHVKPDFFKWWDEHGFVFMRQVMEGISATGDDSGMPPVTTSIWLAQCSLSAGIEVVSPNLKPTLKMWNFPWMVARVMSLKTLLSLIRIYNIRGGYGYELSDS